MADSIDINLITYEQIKAAYPYWTQFPGMDKYISKGKQPLVYSVDVNLDTSGAALAETTKPTNEVLNFTTPQQVWIRSDNAADQGLKIDVIGQKADGTFGQFTLTSDGANGTTPVDVGTWNFIAQPRKNDAWAGNVIIDNDGIGGTIFWTCALGATQTLGILFVPDGYWGDAISGYPSLLADPGAVDEGMLIKIGKLYAHLSRNHIHFPILVTEKNAPLASQTRIAVLNKYDSAAVTVSNIHFMVAIWEE